MTDSLYLSLNEGYNLWSKFYDDDDIPLHLLEESVVDEALGDVRGLSIIDLGCGTGRQTFRLAKNGAQMTGVDQSEGMLAQAASKNAEDRVRFIHANLDGAFPFPDQAFDWVVSFLALEHLAGLRGFFAESRRICRQTGSIYFTAMHPAMTLRGVQARFTEKDTGRKVYPKGYPYQISDYLNAACEAGLSLVRVTEHATENAHAEISERALKYKGWPALLTMRFRP